MDLIAARVVARYQMIRPWPGMNPVEQAAAEYVNKTLLQRRELQDKLYWRSMKRMQTDPSSDWDVREKVDAAKDELQAIDWKAREIARCLKSKSYDKLVQMGVVPVEVVRQYQDRVAMRVAARFQQANQAPGARQEAKKLTHPINKPKGIERSIVTEHARGVNHRDDTLKPERKDIRPEDVFAGTPSQMGVRNLAETGKDLQKVLDKQVPKDKGYDTVSNLSQYLIRTEGGGGTKPVG